MTLRRARRLVLPLSACALVVVAGLLVLRWRLVAVGAAVYTSAASAGLGPAAAFVVTRARLELLVVLVGFGLVCVLLGWQAGGLVNVAWRCSRYDGSDVPGPGRGPALCDFDFPGSGS